MSRTQALIDLVVLVAAVMAAWSLRFAGIPYVGPIAMAVGILVVFLLLRLRRQTLAELGLGRVPPMAILVPEALRLLPWFGLAWLGGGVIGVALFGQPQTAAAVSELPDSVWLFVLDVTLVTWLLIAFGEELVFRGLVLRRLLVLTGNSKPGQWQACAIQAAWFGSLHASQGGAGMVITGFIGFAFAAFLLARPGRSLWPLVFLHGVVDTLVLTVSRVVG